MKKAYVITAIAVSIFILGGCGSKKTSAEEIQFAKDINAFCDEIADVDSKINAITPTSETAVAEMLDYLDDLEVSFKGFADMDFPEEYDYLESVADEASSYMTEAVKYYHEAYSNDAYNEYTADYADENYARAYKRVKIIISFLHGEQPEGVTVN